MDGVEGTGVRSFRKAGVAVGGRAGLGWAGEGPQDPTPVSPYYSSPRESRMGLKKAAPGLSCEDPVEGRRGEGEGEWEWCGWVRGSPEMERFHEVGQNPRKKFPTTA